MYIYVYIYIIYVYATNVLYPSELPGIEIVLCAKVIGCLTIGGYRHEKAR